MAPKKPTAGKAGRSAKGSRNAKQKTEEGYDKKQTFKLGKSPSKRTKKYAQKHLEKEIQGRREQKKWAQRKSSGRGTKHKKDEEEVAKPVPAPASEKPKADTGGVDDFLTRGFFQALDEDEESVSGESESGDEHSDPEEEDDGGEPSGEEGGSDEEEEDESDSDEDPLDGENKELKGSVSKHKQQLEMLKKKDPEFYKYLQENDKNLLDFGGSDDEGDEDNEEADEEDEQRAHAAEGAGDDEDEDSAGGEVLTSEHLRKITAAASKAAAYNPIRDLVRAFDSACHIDEDVPSRGGGPKYKIVSASVFQRLMAFCVGSMDAVFDTYLGLTDVGNKRNVQSSERWGRAKKIIKCYVGALLHFLRELTDANMIHMLLRHCERMIRYFAPFPKTCRLLLKAALRVWGGVEENRVEAFILIRRLALDLPFPFIEMCFKGVYLTMQRNVRFTNSNNVQAQRFMAQCVVELYGLDLNAAYEHAFVYLRQLAVQLRNALTQKTKEARGVVGGWQFLNCLRLWGRCLTAYPSEQQLKPLHYPFVQIALGAMGLLNSARWVPQRLQICETLVHLALTGDVYIPLAPFLTEILFFPEMQKLPKGAVHAPPVDLDATLHLSKAQLATRTCQDSAVTSTLRVLMKYLAAYAHSITYPELLFPISTQLRRYAKLTKVHRHRRQVKDFLDKAERSAVWAEKRREQLEIAPKDVTTLHVLRPAQNEKDNCPLSVALKESLDAATSAQWGDGGNVKVKPPKIKPQARDDDDSEDEYEDGDEGSADDDTEDDEDEGAPRAGGKRGRGGVAKSKKKPRRDLSGEVPGTITGDEDLVEDLVLSDDE